MKTDEVLAWFEVMGIKPTTAEYIRTREIFNEMDPSRSLSAFGGLAMTELMKAPIVRADQFRKFAKSFYKYLKWWYFLRFVPGVRGVALNNNAALMAPNKDSDIDIFIVAKKNTVWLTRGLVTMLAILLKARRTDKNYSGKWCLSFFLEENVPIQSLALKPFDPELLWWENNLLWLVGSKGHPHLCKKAFKWRLYSVMAKPFNQLAYFWQKKIFLKKNITGGEGVVLTPRVAKFHTIDRRREHANTWHKLL